MNNSKLNVLFVTCPVCSGSGRNKLGFNCPNCQGAGLGTFYCGKFYYWGLKLGPVIIELSHVRNKVQLIVSIISYIMAIGGSLSLAIWFILVGNNAEELEEFMFWAQRDPLILLFWTGVVFWMYIIYRTSLKHARVNKVRPVKYEEQVSNLETPNNWEELKKAKAGLKIEVSSGYSPEAMRVVEEAYLLAFNLNHSKVTPLHLFYSCLTDREVAAILSRLGVDPDKIVSKLKENISKIEKGEEKTTLSSEVKEALVEGYIQAGNVGLSDLSPKSLIIPCLKVNELLREILYDFEVDEDKINNVILWFIINEKQVKGYKEYRSAARFKPKANMDRAYTSVATPTLNNVTYDLTLAARASRLEFCVAREEEIEKIWQAFESGSYGVMLVGDSGVGKNTIIGGIAQLMVKEDVPQFLKDKRLVELDASRLISGATPSQAQGRLLTIIDELAKAGNIVLYIDNIEDIFGITTGSEGSLDMSEILATSVKRGDFYCLASVTDKNFRTHIEGKTLADIMARVDILEPHGNQAIQIIESKIANFESKYKVYFSYSAVETVISLSERYIHETKLPEKAVSLLELVAVKALRARGEHAVVNKDDIAEIIGEKTGVPVSKVGENEGAELLNLEEKMHERMIGQNEAINMVSASLRRARTEMRSGKRPIANFLFLGPTGVGKTELAKTVSETYFGNEDYMIRLDMSEYQHPDSIKKMIGDSAGVKGYLTEAVRRSPFSLVLLDELEKAHPDILNLFLQVMDDGRLTDGQGRTIDFTNSIIIATSNTGASYIQEQVLAGTDIEEIKRVLLNEHLVKTMRPEFVNRFDGVIVFEPLTQENIEKITRLMLNSLEKMLDKKGIGLKVDDDGLKRLAFMGYDPKFGARPLRRVIQENVEDQIANKILAGELRRRDSVLIDSDAKIRVIKGVEI